jgi:hypothetical protein
MPEIQQPGYQTSEQARAVEECLNLYSTERKKLLAEIQKKRQRYDDFSHKDTIANIIDMNP